MAHIQLTNGTRLYANGNDGPESIWMHVGSTYTLEHVEWEQGAGKPEPEIHWPNRGSIEVKNVRITGKKQIFTVTARAQGETPILGGVDKSFTKPVVIVSGLVQNHGEAMPREGMVIDLLADVLRGSDPFKVHLIQRMLNNNEDNFFDQQAAHNISKEHGPLACGIVVKERGDQVYGKQPLFHVPQLNESTGVPNAISPIRYEHPYHEPLSRVAKRTDVKYKPQTISNLLAQIRQFLKGGTPVRVGVLDNPVGMPVVGGKLIAYYRGGHTVLIVGCNEANNKFLYMDPLREGSKLSYTGGISDLVVRAPCNYLGIFEPRYEKERLLKQADTGKANVIRTTNETEGKFNTANGYFLEVVSGP
jgi:hypothetical protein